MKRKGNSEKYTACIISTKAVAHIGNILPNYQLETSTAVIPLLIKDGVSSEHSEERKEHNGKLRMIVRSTTESGKENVQLTVKCFAGDAQNLSANYKADCYIMAFDPTERTSFYELVPFKEKLIQLHPNIASESIISVLEIITIGDSVAERVISTERVEKLMKKDFLGCSKHELHLDATIEDFVLADDEDADTRRNLIAILANVVVTAKNHFAITKPSFINRFRSFLTSISPTSTPSTTTSTTSTTSISTTTTSTTSTTMETTATTYPPSTPETEVKKKKSYEELEEELRRTQERLYDARSEIYQLTNVCGELRNSLRDVKQQCRDMKSVIDLFELGNQLPHVAQARPKRSVNKDTAVMRCARHWKEITQLRANERYIQKIIAEEEMERQAEINKKEYQCVICYDSYGIEDIYVIDGCCHRFCFPCVSSHIKTQVSEGNCRDIKCPAFGCTVSLHPQEIRHCVDKETFKKYEDFSLKNALDAMGDLVYCPRPDCNNVMIGNGDDNPQIKCTNEKCQFTFCKNCQVEWHKNSTCEQYQQWKSENSQSDSKTQEWIKQNAKTCPRCKSSIEKNGGCNHMTCRNCQYEFCWLCGKKYESNHFGNMIWSCKQFS